MFLEHNIVGVWWKTVSFLHPMHYDIVPWLGYASAFLSCTGLLTGFWFNIYIFDILSIERLYAYVTSYDSILSNITPIYKSYNDHCNHNYDLAG